MTDTISVAPREITDLVFRASRVVGCEASMADRIAAAVTFTEVHHRCGLREFVEFADHDPAGLSSAAAEAIVPNHAAPALFRRRAEHRLSDASTEVEHQALARGVVVDRGLWARIEAIAAGFLLSEAILDAVAD